MKFAILHEACVFSWYYVKWHLRMTKTITHFWGTSVLHILLTYYFLVYFDANEACNSLDFQFGNAARGITAIPTRSFSIRVTQYSCNYNNLAPSGCDQYFFGPTATNQIATFNFAGGRHLANQHQTVCIRHSLLPNDLEIPQLDKYFFQKWPKIALFTIEKYYESWGITLKIKSYYSRGFWTNIFGSGVVNVFDFMCIWKLMLNFFLQAWGRKLQNLLSCCCCWHWLDHGYQYSCRQSQGKFLGWPLKSKITADHGW